VTAWITGHKAAALGLALLLVVILWLMFRRSSSAGHASPEDAIASGWSVFPAGIGMWLETSPDGSQSIMHESGWTGDPYARL
jgi:hypothetical protein